MMLSGGKWVVIFLLQVIATPFLLATLIVGEIWRTLDDAIKYLEG